jgi:AcrR family transcriptional regulator
MNQTQSQPSEAPKPLRADAQRNRLRVLAAAREAFEAEGITVNVEAIAKRAGVGVGTVYRHFPTKEALFEAIILTNLQAFVEDAHRLADAPDAGAAFYAYLERVFIESDASMAIKDALSGTDFQENERAAGTFRELEAAIEHLLKRSQAAGATRPDVTIEELLALVGGACRACSGLRGNAASSRRLASVICDGLRPSFAPA